MKALGAAYLIYLRLQTIMTARSAESGLSSNPRTKRRLFRDGVIVSVLNPKIAVFFMAFLPQFVDPSRGSVGSQILLLGIMYSVLALVTDSGYAFLAAGPRKRLSGPLISGPMPRYTSGAVYVGLGIGTAFVDRR